MKKNFMIHLNYYDDFKEIQYYGDLQNLTEVFILCKYSFDNQSVDINNLIHNPKNVKISGKIKLNFSAEQIMKFKNDKIDFYILDKERLMNIFVKMGIKFKVNSNIFMEDKITYKILYFQDGSKYISFNKAPSLNNNINNQNKNFQSDKNINFANNNAINNINNNFVNVNINNAIPFPKTIQNNINLLANEDKSKIIQSLIFLYGNEKDIMRFYSEGIYKLENYYLVNKIWIDKFKEIYSYNEICKIPLIQQLVQSINDINKNLQFLVNTNEIKAICSKINLNNYTLNSINLFPETKTLGENFEYSFPIHFVIIHQSLLNLLKNYSNNNNYFEYEINFGKLSLCIRLKSDLNKIYIYSYNKNSFKISGIIELFDDAWKNIYDRHLSKKVFNQYLKDKQINLNLINQKQKLLSSGNAHLGYIYLINNIGENNTKVEKLTESNNNLIRNNTNNNPYYQKLLQSLNIFMSKSISFDINSIDIYIENNFIEKMILFIIETQKLNYLGTLNQLNESDIIACEQLSNSIKYSFINAEICIYFKIANINNLPKVYFVINGKDKYIYDKNKHCLLKILNYMNNTFNIQKITQQPASQFKTFDTQNNTFDAEFINLDSERLPIPTDVIGTSTIDKNHTLGLENIGATCYMNATLQCLCHIKSLKDYFLDDNRFHQDIMARPARLTQSFAQVVRRLWSQTIETYYAPRDFKDTISQMNPLFQGIQANDSKDLVLFIFENIHSELNNPSQNPNEINLNNIRKELYQFRQNYYSQNYSIISQIFYYEQSNIMQCKSCNFETYNFNIMNMIIFPLEKVRLYMQKTRPQGFIVVTLYDCFDQNEQPEMLEGANQIFCNNCRLNSNASSCNKLYTCPEVLTIILNRGKGLEFKVEFSFPLTLSIEKYVTDKTCDPNYELIGVLTHHGPSGMAGHFVAYCKSPINGQWYFYNDATVTQCSSDVEREMQSNGIPYILFYQRRKVKTVGNYESKCIYLTFEGKEGYYDYTDDNKLLYEVYNEFRNKYAWAPEGGRLMLMKNDNMLDLDEYKSLRDNGINDKDKICIIIN